MPRITVTHKAKWTPRHEHMAVRLHCDQKLTPHQIAKRLNRTVQDVLHCLERHQLVPHEPIKPKYSDYVSKGAPADRRHPPRTAPICVIEEAKATLGSALRVIAGGYYINGKPATIGQMLRAANDIRERKGEKLLGRDWDRWGQ